MNQSQVNGILKKRKQWLNDEPGGECADLWDANLRGADLRNADLWDANLQNANLQNANLRNANLQNADLWDANLQNANLRNADLWDANLQNANLQNANLRNANLRGADLRNADLWGADIDYSSWPLWYGSLGVHIDDRIAIQLLYHLIYNVNYSEFITDDVKRILLQPEIIELANKFHRVDGCGKIKSGESK